MANVNFERDGLEERDLPEVLAGYVVSVALDVDVDLTDLQRGRCQGRQNGQCDIAFSSSKSGRAVGEVVTTRIQPLWAQRNRLAMLGAHRYTKRKDLSRRWTVTLERHAKVDSTLANVPEILRRLEAKDLDRVTHASGLVRLTILDAGIGSCHSVKAPPGEGGGFRVFSPGTGGFGEDGAAVLDECMRFIATDVGTSKMVKLLAAEASERHLFIVVFPQDWPHIYFALRDLQSLPAESPAFPEAIDGMWVVPFSEPAIALCWYSGRWSQINVAGWTPSGFAWG